jgi:hypothetical protein
MKCDFLLILFLMSTCLSKSAFGQRCGLQNPLNYINEHEKSEINASKRTLKEYNIVFHIVFQNEIDNISDSRIYSQLEVLNRIFQHYDPGENNGIPQEFRILGKTPEIKFCLASTDPKGQRTTGITRTKTMIDDIGCRSEFGRKNIMTSALGRNRSLGSEKIYQCIYWFTHQLPCR